MRRYCLVILAGLTFGPLTAPIAQAQDYPSRQIALIAPWQSKSCRSPIRRTVTDSNASRKKRVASGSGTSVQDINKLVKMHRQMADMMKAMGKKRGIFSQMFGAGRPPEMPAELPQGAGLQQGGLPPLPPGGFPGLPGGLPRGLPGIPRGLPGLPGSKKR